MTTPINQNLYAIASGSSSTSAFIEVFETRDPTSNDINYPVQKRWFNTLSSSEWILVNFSTITGDYQANWVQANSGGLVATVYDADSGSASPSSSILNVFGGSGISTSGSGNTITISSNSILRAYTNVNFSMSPYSVLASDYYLSVDCSLGPVSLLFPNSPTSLQTWIIKDRTGSASTNAITVTTVASSLLIDGSTSIKLTSNYESIQLLANSSLAYEVY